MDKIIVSIYDRKAEYYLPIWLTENIETAKRQFLNLVNDSETLINKNPEDYIMFQVGVFDDRSGKVTELIHHKEIINGLTKLKGES